MAKITYTIKLDASTNTATASTKPPDAKFNIGDEVSFTSDWPDTVIKYTNGSPFKELKAGKPVELPAGPYKIVKTTDTHHTYHFECGSYQAAQVVTPGSVAPEEKVFVAWKGGGDTPRK